MKIIFATPAYRGVQCGPFLDSLEATVTLCMACGYETEFIQLAGSPYVQTARNTLLMQAYNKGADKVFFLDDDISWKPLDAIRLIESGYDVVAGLYRFKQDEVNYPVVLYTDDNGQACYREDGSLAAARVPTGFLCIDRKVIAQLIEAYPQQRYIDGADEVVLYDLFPQGIRDGQWVGEDYAFCDLCTDIGIKIFVVPDIDLCHYSSTTRYDGNFLKWLQSLSGDDNES